MILSNLYFYRVGPLYLPTLRHDLRYYTSNFRQRKSLITPEFGIARDRFVTSNAYFIPNREESDVGTNGDHGPAERVADYGWVVEGYDGFRLDMCFEGVEREGFVADEDFSWSRDVSGGGIETDLRFGCWKVGCEVSEVGHCRSEGSSVAGGLRFDSMRRF